VGYGVGGCGTEVRAAEVFVEIWGGGGLVGCSQVRFGVYKVVGSGGDRTGAADSYPCGFEFDLACFYLWDGDFFEAEVAFAVETEGVHGTVTVWRWLEGFWGCHGRWRLYCDWDDVDNYTERNNEL
jgi:hypothetical protein